MPPIANGVLVLKDTQEKSPLAPKDTVRLELAHFVAFGKMERDISSTSQLHSMRYEHARQSLQGKHPFALSLVSSPRTHSHLPPLEAGDSQQMGPVSTRLSLHGLSERMGPD